MEKAFHATHSTISSISELENLEKPRNREFFLVKT